MANTETSTPSGARGEAVGLYPHSCRHCADLIIDTRKLNWVETLRFKYGWLKEVPVKIAMGRTVSEADESSQFCSFFRSIITRGIEHPYLSETLMRNYTGGYIKRKIQACIRST